MARSLVSSVWVSLSTTTLDDADGFFYVHHLLRRKLIGFFFFVVLNTWPLVHKNKHCECFQVSDLLCGVRNIFALEIRIFKFRKNVERIGGLYTYTMNWIAAGPLSNYIPT